ncbi:hypothetical protein BV898_13057 [Hypsibius exemplaris]|uniref:G-protein coupled receptors family 1 profile domain-containing protein n=1 Tax=Hypsibius exemplaris TaxID=2072580 RepID=A0A1W0WC31_HYPEX|nr:hypothetical protein BV898_13057 [Hypsibius exemplaris]
MANLTKVLSLVKGNGTFAVNVTSIPPNFMRTIMSWFTIFTIVATLVTNGFIIVVYITRGHLRTAFNAYIFNIALTEALTAILAMPGIFVLSFYGYWPYSPILCSAFTFVKQHLGSGVRYGHVLVTVNRMWAVTFPLDYRTAHTKRVSNCLIISTWIFVLGLNCPSAILGRLNPVIYPVDFCRMDYRGYLATLAFGIEFVGYDVPEIIIVFAYPFVLYKLRQLRGNTKIGQVGVSAGVQTGPRMFSLEAVVPANASNHLPPSLVRLKTIDEDVVLPPAQQQPAPHRRRRKIMSRSHYRVLAYFVVGVIVCWTPNHLYYLLVDIINYRNDIFSAVQFFAQSTYSWINPILCYLAMQQLREAVKDLIFNRR